MFGWPDCMDSITKTEYTDQDRDRERYEATHRMARVGSHVKLPL